MTGGKYIPGKPVAKKEPRISTPSIRRLARRGGVRRMSFGISNEIRSILKAYIRNVLSKTMIYTDAAKRTTVTPIDVVHGLKAIGTTSYGFN